MQGIRRVALLLSVGLAACGIDKADIGADPPPLILREEGTTPADSTQFLHDAQGVDLVGNFNRSFDPGGVSHLQLVPHPANLGGVENPAPNPRQVVLHDVVLAPAFQSYHLVLDGPAMPAPVVLTYYSADHEVLEGGIGGRVTIERGKTSSADALVYALVPLGRDTEFPLSGSEQTLFGRPVLGVTKSLHPHLDEPGWFLLTGLENFRRYLVFALLDTSRDGEYDPEVDWWGYFRDDANIPVELMAGVTLGPLHDPPLPDRPWITFDLQAPGTLEPWLD